MTEPLSSSFINSLVGHVNFPPARPLSQPTRLLLMDLPNLELSVKSPYLSVDLNVEKLVDLNWELILN
ncbi:hypothetical protein P8452_51621 [Trifolium repens]|nr:hypothetical protein P8452_51621 [Trifolium repens]